LNQIVIKMIQSALQVLLLISITTSTSWVPEDPYKCFEHDNPPVDTSATFQKYCKDNHGNIYKPTRPEDPAQLKSCCECLEYQCTDLYKTKMLYWKTSVSDHCCLACTNTTYKADTVIETIERDDDCKSIETQVCRKLPGYEKAKIESEFHYKACCNDNTGLQMLGTEVYQPSTCSQRTCFYDKYLPFSLWISKQVLPGCDCCLRYDPKTRGKHLVEDGTTWIVDGKVYECCRGDIVMKTHTKPPANKVKVVLITGGLNKEDHEATVHSAEIFLPDFPDSPCILPALPVAYSEHSQDGGLLCGGYAKETRFNCRQWNSTEGNFPAKPVHEFKHDRKNHVSWTPVAEKETFLIGGGGTDSGAMNSSTIVKPGVFEGSHGFDLTIPIYAACAIPDPDTDTLIITGGDPENETSTSLYNEDGFIESFGTLNHGRAHHGCTSYVTHNKRIFMVTGGDYTDTTETKEIGEGKKWTVLKTGNLVGISTGKISEMRLITINNVVFSFGGYGSKVGAISSIFKFNVTQGKWHIQSYSMSRPRYLFGASVVDFNDYSKACKK